MGLGKGEFLVVERDDDALPGDPAEKIEKKIYRFNLNGATDVSTYTGTVGATGKTVDQLTTAELVANKINPIFKMLHVDLNQAGYNRVQKVEGLAVIDQWTLAVINDNDFGVAGIIPQPNGTFILAPGYVPEKVELGLIDVRLNGMDASDADNAINIRQWPVKGMYMPDSLASYKVGQETYLVTANEGDAREYISGGVTYLNEVVRVGSNSVVLDAAAFPNPVPLKAAGSLGRLNITNTMGRDPISGKYRELFSFGGRSFSIWKTDGTLVFDSGDELEWLTALAYPANFNASNTNNSFDNRSDDKGPEPEGVVVGSAFGRQYAFIG
ncbi:MAG: esterase-like activity of phytase family protein, partial [Rhodoglobus sp.]|nr:esterase-like activity of phytase family protein [Rhodoglobus sp.]